jgi:site-specific recombinase XerD
MAGGSIMKKPSNGPFRDLIEQYLQLRRSLGAILQGAECGLNKFDLYLSRRFPDAKTITKPMVVDYLQTLKHLEASTVYLRFMALRQFCRFLFRLNTDTYIPEKRLVRRGRTLRLPHIYTNSEAMELIKLASKLTPRGSLRPLTYSTLFSLLWVSGLRIREALRLNLEDVDTGNAVIHIRESKFFKSRLVPLTVSSAAALETYRRRRAEQDHDQRPDAPFFVNERARRCSYGAIEKYFLVLVRQIGITTAQGRNPRLHDFRHTFATRYLDEVYKTGRDPNASLPLLATYLGHVKVTYTQVYLHPASSLLATAGHRFYEYVHKSDNLTKGASREGI